MPNVFHSSGEDKYIGGRMRKKAVAILAIIVAVIFVLGGCEVADSVFSNVRFVDDSGTVYGIKQIDGKPRVSSVPYLYDIAEGNVANHYALHKFGYNSTVGAAEETIWEESTPYSYLAAATVLKISSSDVDDTAAGAGARTVAISGLDTNYDEINETITLNGRTAVNSVNSYLRIFRGRVLTAGATESNEGTIYVGTGAVVAGVPANVYATITVGHNQSLMAFWTVPNAHTAYMTHFYASTGVANKTTEILLYIRPLNEVFQVQRRYHIIAGVVDRTFTLPLGIVAKSDIEVRGTAAGGGGAISASFDMWYEAN